jgi:pimeloyl-ACP methyl ester carboxylesterase
VLRPEPVPVVPAPDADATPESLVVRVDTGDAIHFLDWGGPTAGTPAGPGAEPPALVLVHGLAQTAWAWAPVARRLRAVTRVVAMDLRGHGLSDAPRVGYDLTSLAYDLLTVLTANGLGPDADGPPVVLAGHGFGAQVAAVAAVERPGAVSALALVDGGWEDLEEATRQGAAEFVRGLTEPPEVMRSMAAYLADRRDYDPPTWDADQERAARAAVHEVYAGHVVPVTRRHALDASVTAMFAYRPVEVLARVAAPTVVVVAGGGEIDDPVERERMLALDDALGVLGRETGGGAAAAHVVRLRGAGHNVMRYRPDEVSAALLWALGAGATTGGTRGGRA